MQNLPTAFNAMAEYKSWLIYKKIWNEYKGKFDKIPMDPRTGNSFAKGSNWQKNPDAVTDAREAIQMSNELGDDFGVGFLFTENDPFFFVDLDNCADASTENGWSHVANDIMTMLPGAAVDTSMSGKGLHIFAKGNPDSHSCRHDALGLEFYTSGRFVALTGAAIGDSSLEMTDAVTAMAAKYFPMGAKVKDQSWTTTAVDNWNGIKDEREL